MSYNGGLTTVDADREEEEKGDKLDSSDDKLEDEDEPPDINLSSPDCKPLILIAPSDGKSIASFCYYFNYSQPGNSLLHDSTNSIL